MNFSQLRATVNRLIGQMSAILDRADREDRDLTAEETAAFDRLKAETAPLKARLDRSVDLHAIEIESGAAGRGRFGGQFASLGEFMHAVRFNPRDRRLSYVENVAGQRAEMRMDDGPSGGFAIPPQFLPKLMALKPQSAIIRPRATVIPAGSPPDAAITIPALDQTGSAPSNMFGGVQVGWIGEGGLKPNTDMKLREVTLTPHEVAGLMTVTDKLLRNWQSASGVLEQQLSGAISQAEDLAFLAGNGIGKPLGFLRSTALYRVGRQIAGSVTYDDIVSMVVHLYGNGVFFYSRSMLGALMRLKDGQGRPLWLPSIREGEPATLMGFPAIENTRNPSLGTLGDLSLVDLSQYLIKDGSGPFVATSEHALFAQNKTLIKVFWNVDGAPWMNAPFQNEGGDLVSPFVALDVPSA